MQNPDYTYTKFFNPVPLLQDFRDVNEKAAREGADRRDGKVYFYDEDVVLRVNVALATGRPLLVQGRSGCGKSSLAYNIARVMRRRYYERVMTARDQARDLLWRFDAVRRLGDAQMRAISPRTRGEYPNADPLTDVTAFNILGPPSRRFESYCPYIEPEVLWWVFDRDSAVRRGLPRGEKINFPAAADPVIYEPHGTAQEPQTEPAQAPCVVLIDEIDKPDPNVPNDLLVPLGSLQFRVQETDQVIRFHTAQDDLPESDRLPLVLITSNDERRLPAAFVRRCVQLTIGAPKRDRLFQIAKATEGDSNEVDEVCCRVYEALERMPQKESSTSVAEFLDAVRACLRLGADSKTLIHIMEATMEKSVKIREGSP